MVGGALIIEKTKKRKMDTLYWNMDVYFNMQRVQK